MRQALKDIGENNSIIIYAQFSKSGGYNQRIMIKDVYNLVDNQYLADHIWLDKTEINCNRQINDILVISGKIYRYTKYYNQEDYGIIPSNCILVKLFVFRGSLFFCQYSNQSYVYYRYIQGYDPQNEYIDLQTNNIRHLVDDYNIDNETTDTIQISYNNSSLLLYKNLRAILQDIKVQFQ